MILSNKWIMYLLVKKQIYLIKNKKNGKKEPLKNWIEEVKKNCTLLLVQLDLVLNFHKKYNGVKMNQYNIVDNNFNKEIVMQKAENQVIIKKKEMYLIYKYALHLNQPVLKVFQLIMVIHQELKDNMNMVGTEMYRLQQEQDSFNRVNFLII